MARAGVASRAGTAWAAAIGLLAMVLGPTPGVAHDASIGVDGTEISIRTPSSVLEWQFHFATRQQTVLAIEHDPADEGFKLLVRGTGANADRTSLISLDATRWEMVQGEGGPVYHYSDPTGLKGGVTHARLGAGFFEVDASGANWEFDISGPQDSVWVHFSLEDEWYCAAFSSETQAVEVANATGAYEASGAVAPAACPELVCGNGIHELGEECDDGNFVETDGCNSQCEVVACENVEYTSTFAAIHGEVFTKYGCTSCHSTLNAQGGLDLSFAVAHQNLVGKDSANFTNKQKLVLPGESKESFLYRKLAGDHQLNPLVPGEGGPMPNAGGIPHDLLEAIGLWIRNGAPDAEGNLVVEGTASLLSACLPEPTPVKVTPLDPPPNGTGIQLRMPPWTVPARSEDEICMATYYDLRGGNLVPEEYRVPCPGLFGPFNTGDECFAYNKIVLLQDPHSHHSINHLYTGDYDVTYVDPTQTGRDFGAFTFKDESVNYQVFPPELASKGDSCDPKQVLPWLGYNPECAGKIKSTVACNGNAAPGGFANLLFGGGFGAPDFTTGGAAQAGIELTAPAWGGSQESYNVTDLPPGTFGLMPMKGVPVWNSHAFNTTNETTTMEQYVNIYFAPPEDRHYPIRGIFEGYDIFAQNVPAYGTELVCGSFTLPKNANLVTLNSHTHYTGVQFTMYAPSNEPCVRDGNATKKDPNCHPGPDDKLIYLSTEYTDPIELVFDPALHFDETTTVNERTFRFCSLYDNGSRVGSPEVKRRSLSPEAPSGFAPFIPSGGPCSNDTVSCLGGADAGELCFGADWLCDSGLCDACPMTGGVTTLDEMFIAIGSYFLAAADFDVDGIPNSTDPDDDNDGWTDEGEAACNSDPLNGSSKPADTDNDSQCDFVDADDDNDGTADGDDAFPLDAAETKDNDTDGVGDNADTDDDNDGAADDTDAFPFDPAESNDNDKDGVGDNADADDDNDGWKDGDEGLCATDAMDGSSVPVDRDNDGVCDVEEDRQLSERRCTKMKNRAIWRDVQCRFRAAVRAIRNRTKADVGVSGCQSKMTRSFEGAEKRFYGCATPGDVGQRAEENRSFVEARMEAIAMPTAEGQDAAPSRAEKRCSLRRSRAIAKHYQCEYRAQSIQSRGAGGAKLAEWIRARCDRYITKALLRVQKRSRNACSEIAATEELISSNREAVARSLGLE